MMEITTGTKWNAKEDVGSRKSNQGNAEDGTESLRTIDEATLAIADNQGRKRGQ